MTRSLTRDLVSAVSELRPGEADLAAVRALLLDHLADAGGRCIGGFGLEGPS